MNRFPKGGNSGGGSDGGGTLFEPAESRQLSKWGMFVVTLLFFGMLIGAMVAMAKGLTTERLGYFLAAVLGGGWVAGVGLGRLLGWPMFLQIGPN